MSNTWLQSLREYPLYKLLPPEGECRPWVVRKFDSERYKAKSLLGLKQAHWSPVLLTLFLVGMLLQFHFPPFLLCPEPLETDHHPGSLALGFWVSRPVECPGRRWAVSTAQHRSGSPSSKPAQCRTITRMLPECCPHFCPDPFIVHLCWTWDFLQGSSLQFSRTHGGTFAEQTCAELLQHTRWHSKYL